MKDSIQMSSQIKTSKKTSKNINLRFYGMRLVKIA